MKKKKFDLLERLIDFAVRIIKVAELRETKVWLIVIYRTEMIKPRTRLIPLISENDELISILFRSVETARKNLSTK
jgi:hypothetical protein